MTLPVVRLGFAAPFSGPQAIVGRPMSQAAQLAVDEANEEHKLPFRLELRAEDLRRAAHALARITGRIDAEMVLDQVFGRFCIGK